MVCIIHIDGPNRIGIRGPPTVPFLYPRPQRVHVYALAYIYTRVSGSGGCKKFSLSSTGGASAMEKLLSYRNAIFRAYRSYTYAARSDARHKAGGRDRSQAGDISAPVGGAS